MKPLVTIALPVYNCAETLPVTMRSVLSQTMTDWELLIVDDGSSDDTVEIARQYADPRIHVFSEGKNAGISERLNQAIERASGYYIARQDGDDISYPDRLEKQVAFLQQHDDIDLLAARMVTFRDDGSLITVSPTVETHEEICAKPWAGMFQMAHPTWIGKRTWYDKYRYDPVNKKGEDRELLLRAYRESRFACLPEVLVGYRNDHLTLRKNLSKRAWFSWALLMQSIQQVNPSLLLGVAEQSAKASIEMVAVALGQRNRAVRKRILDITDSERATWDAVWEACQTESANRPASAPIAKAA